MKVTVEFGHELEPALQQHFDKGTKVQDYIKAAVVYFNVMKKAESEGKKCGFGDSSRFSTYNTEASPNTALYKVENGEIEWIQKPREVIDHWISSLDKPTQPLTDWEEHFVASLSFQLAKTGRISEKQQNILERIYSEKTS